MLAWSESPSRVIRGRCCSVIAWLLIVVTACSPGNAELVPDASVQSDLAALAETTFSAFLASAPGVSSCLGNVRLRAATQLDDLATYAPATSTITVRVPATAPSLRDSIVHELGHHLEAVCDSHADLRIDFLAAQGFALDQPWFEGDGWEHTPSEHFAEAVVLVILGRRQRNLGRLHLDTAAVELVANWLNPSRPGAEDSQ